METAGYRSTDERILLDMIFNRKVGRSEKENNLTPPEGSEDKTHNDDADYTLADYNEESNKKGSDTVTHYDLQQECAKLYQYSPY